MTSDIDTALALLEAPKIIATRLRALSREHLPERKQYKQAYGKRKRAEKWTRREFKREAFICTRETERARLAWQGVQFEDQPGAR